MEHPNELREFIEEHCCPGYAEVAEPPTPIEGLANGLEESFSVMLIKLIRAKGREEKDVYRRANIDRRHFSKIRSNVGYSPAKKTVLAIAVALELTLDETRGLLERAGYALSRGILEDVIVEYFITKGKYDIFEINEALFRYGRPLLGGAME